MNLIKLYNTCFTLAFLFIIEGCSSLNQNSMSDEYNYIKPPMIEQSSDLHDSDHDGVINARDRCPSTESKAKINNDGCGHILNTKEKQHLNILFARDSDTVNPIFLGQIKKMAVFLDNYPATSVEIKGHTSLIGDKDWNLTLSKKRATTVMNWLLHYGVKQSRIKIIGYGENDPAEEAKSELADAKNRRVTAIVVAHTNIVEKEWSIFFKIPKEADFH